MVAVVTLKSGNGLQCQLFRGNLRKLKNFKFKMATTFSHLSGEAVLVQILAESSGESSDSDEIHSVENCHGITVDYHIWILICMPRTSKPSHGLERG